LGRPVYTDIHIDGDLGDVIFKIDKTTKSVGNRD
jgi:hypothetical protein